MPSRPPTPTLRPCLAELLRTCVHPPAPLLRVEKVIFQYSSGRQCPQNGGLETGVAVSEQQNITLRLILGDGELLIQALLESSLHEVFQLQDIGAGTLLRLRHFHVRRTKRLNALGEVVYLGISDYEIALSGKPATRNVRNELEEGGFIREGTPPFAPQMDKMVVSVRSLNSVPAAEMAGLPSSQDLATSDHFETKQIDTHALERRRQALHQLNNDPQSQGRGSNPSRKRRKTQQPPGFSSATPQNPPRPPRSISAFTPALHTILSLISPPSGTSLPRSYSVTLFCLITYLSPSLIYPRPTAPFPPKRQIKMHDLSISERKYGITLAVYVDPEDFKPEVGTIGLLRGVTVQKCPDGGVMVNAYPRLKEEWGEKGGWFVSDEADLERVGLAEEREALNRWWTAKGVERDRNEKVQRVRSNIH